MEIYLPIAEISTNVFLLLGLGGAIGFLSGMFGVGGGFLVENSPPLVFDSFLLTPVLVRYSVLLCMEKPIFV